MTRHYGDVAFTRSVRDIQERRGSRAFYARRQAATSRADPAQRREAPDALGEEEEEFVATRDSFYLATVGESGWPYVQFRGGQPGFLTVLDPHTVGWADFRGNYQYVSFGNLTSSSKAALLLMDYPHRQRLKIFGHIRFAEADDEPELVQRLRVDGYEAVIEHVVVVTVEAFDWNCQQHITPRYTLAELGISVSPGPDR